MTQSIRNTPRGAQDKQPLALTQSELPWTPADYKTRSDPSNPVQYRVRSRESHTGNL